MLIRLLVCASMGAARLAELAYSRRNLQHGAEPREGAASRATFPLIVLVHTTVILGTALRGGRPRLPWLALLFAAQPLRLWVLLTLRHRWNARGSVAPDLQVATNGPYAYVRHPNYAVVIVELLALPLAFGLRQFAIGAAVVNGILLTLRIRDEERLLRELPGYVEHFDDMPRLVPVPRLTRRTGDSARPKASATADR
jgi:methyltransferase